MGLLYQQHGWSLWQAIASTALISAGPLQLYLLHSPQPTMLFAALAALVINFRFLLMASLIYPYFKLHPRWLVLPTMFAFATSSFTVTYTHSKTGDIAREDIFYYFLAVALPSYVAAVLATAFGYYFLRELSNGKIIHVFMIVLPIHFAALTAKRSQHKLVLLATAMGFFLTPIVNTLHSTLLAFSIPLILGVLLAMIHRKQGKAHV
jgi:predicted branched-subunit amino acid permease